MYTADGDKPHFTESVETIDDLKKMGLPVKNDIKYYAELCGGARGRMDILHNIHKRNGHTLDKNIGIIDCYDGESYQIFENSKK